MKVWISAIGLFVLLLVFGCGGGGTPTDGSTDGNTDNSTTGIARVAVEATKNGTIIDPTNIVEGETVQFVVAGYTAANQRIVQSSSGWTADPGGQLEGTMSSSGLFTAANFGAQFTVSATVQGLSVGGIAQVKAAGQAIVTGRVVNGFGVFVYGSKIDFYDSTSTLVGTSIVQGNGTFRAVVPATATTFEVRKTSIPSGYYKQYQFATKWYLPQGVCRAPLPALSNGVTTALSGDIVVPPTSSNGASLPPPPPPSPCS